MPNILVDGIHLGLNLTGVGRYVSNILERMAGYDNSFKFYVSVISDIPGKILPVKDNISYYTVPWVNHFWHGFRTLPLFAQKIKADAALIPYDLSVINLKLPYIIISHDIMIWENAVKNSSNFRNIFSKAYFAKKIDDFLISYAFSKAGIVFSNTHYVGRWIRKKIRIDNNSPKVRVAYCAPGVDFEALSKQVNTKKVRMELNAPNGYILAFYTGAGWENLTAILNTYSKFIKSDNSYHLVIAGVKEKQISFVEKFIVDFSWKDRVRIVPFLGANKIKRLAEIYSAASLYLDLSLHEGFGMQVVEAMACGVPVVCSNRGALPEVTGGCAVLVEPLNSSEASEAIIRVISDKKLRQTLIAKGRQRAAFFSWDKTACLILNALKELTYQ